MYRIIQNGFSLNFFANVFYNTNVEIFFKKTLKT